MKSQSNFVAVHLLVQGRVQGVGFRFFAQETAENLGLVGWVQNRPDGSVEAYAEGKKEILEDWIRRLRKGPPLSRVGDVIMEWRTPQGDLRSYCIR